jgi:hypothetical protein
MIKSFIKQLLKEPQSPQTRGEVARREQMRIFREAKSLNRDKNNMVQTFKNQSNVMFGLGYLMRKITYNNRNKIDLVSNNYYG